MPIEDFFEFEHTIITIIAAIAVFAYQHFKHKNERFKQYASDLYREDNQTAQITSAILLREYLAPIFPLPGNFYKKNTLNLIVAILRNTKNGNFQKTLADSISYITEADGQDFQNVNLHKVSIKPKTRIQYEITNDDRFLQKHISLRCADFYQADISFSGIYNINATKAVFNDTLLYNTNFHNCILKDADFKKADIANLKFKSCILEGANFKGASKVASAMVFESQNSKDGKSLLHYLDEEGIFVGYEDTIRYKVNQTPIKIFVSKLGHMNTKQQSYYTHIKEYLKKEYKYDFIFIDPKDYRDSGQIDTITHLMSECAGILVMAFSYIHVENGDMVGGSNKISNQEHISPWLQIEAALANTLYKLPCMIIMEENVHCNGIFEERVTNNEELIQRIDYKGNFNDTDIKMLRNWSRKVEQYHNEKSAL